MQLDYNINISKLSFGDYRIKEKTPYYFVIETDRVDDFIFTFQVVGKLIDVAINNAIIANKAINLSDEVCFDNVESVEIKNTINEDLN